MKKFNSNTKGAELQPIDSAILSADHVAEIDLFIRDQDIRPVSRTLYAKVVRFFISWVLSTERKVNNLTRADIIAYKETLLDSGLSPRTVASYLVGVRRFYEWAEGAKIYPNIAKGIKSPSTRSGATYLKQHLDNEKGAELLEYFRQSNLRDYALVNLLLRTGIRTVEAVRANLEDITFKGGRRVLKVWGKGRDGKDDFVVLSDLVFGPIAEYVAQERAGAKNNEPLFVSTSNNNQGGRLSTRTVSKICKAGLVAIGLNSREYTAHSLRHTTAVQLLKMGAEISQVQNVMRHRSPVATMPYIESAREEIRLKQASELMLDGAFKK